MGIIWFNVFNSNKEITEPQNQSKRKNIYDLTAKYNISVVGKRFPNKKMWLKRST